MFTNPKSIGLDIVMALAGLIGAVLYCDWIFLEPFIGRDLSPVSSYVSEMGALTHPHHDLVNALDIISGLCIAFFSLRLIQRLSEVGLSKGLRIGCLGLTFFGLATALGALVPLTCMPSLQPTCAAGGLALQGPLRDMGYTALSIVANIGVEVSMMLFGRGMTSMKGWAVTARTGWWIFILSAPLGVLDAIFLLFYPLVVGLPQRALLLLQSAWIIAIAAALLGNARRLGFNRSATYIHQCG